MAKRKFVDPGEKTRQVRFPIERDVNRTWETNRRPTLNDNYINRLAPGVPQDGPVFQPNRGVDPDGNYPFRVEPEFDHKRKLTNPRPEEKP